MVSLTKWIAAPALALGLVFVGDTQDASAQYGCYGGYGGYGVGYGGGISVSVGRGGGYYSGYRAPLYRAKPVPLPRRSLYRSPLDLYPTPIGRYPVGGHYGGRLPAHYDRFRW